jgi:TonB-dependent starch-binding outer membrane protein SusC
MQKLLTQRAFWWKAMRFTLVQLAILTSFTAVCLAGNVSAQDPLSQTVSIVAEDKEMGFVLKQIEKQAKLKFVFSPQVVNIDQRISVTAKNEPLTQVFEAVFAPLRIRYEVSGKYILLNSQENISSLSKIKLRLPAMRPPSQIKGTVTDEKSLPMIGVNVLLKGTSTGNTTDAEGRFQLEVPDQKGVLVFSFIGYETQEININTQTIFNVQLFPEKKALDEVIVVGYGTRKKEDVNGAVTQIGVEMISLQPVTSIDQAIAGLTPGVSLREGTGAPGAGPEILIRGINTFGNNKPLFVIDDVIFENGNDQNNNPLALINPEDIETITILKDAATKAIYGSRATAGVVLVTTKRGKAGKPKITFNSSLGTSSILEFERPDVLNATELAQFFKEVNIDRIRASNPLYAELTTPVPDDLIPAQYRNPQQYGTGTNWFDEITRDATTQNHNISVSGGNSVVRYFISGNYLNQEGVVIGNDLTRIAFRSNVDIKLSNKLRMGFNLNPSRTQQNRPADDPGAGQFSAYGTITSAYWVDPSVPVFAQDGLYNYTTKGSLTTNWTANPVYQLDQEVEKRLGNQLLLNGYLEYEVLPKLVLKTKLSYGYNYNRSRNFKPSNLVGDGSLTPVFPNLDGARALLFNTASNNLTSDNLLTYQLKSKRHSLDVLAGWTVQDVSTENSSLSARRIIDENFQLPDFNNVDRAVAGAFTGAEDFSEARLTSLIGRVNYAFADRYLFNVSIRRDGSSRFGRTVQYGNFPAGSVAWRLSEEPFMKSLKSKWLDDLRLEVGYGITGNNNVTAYGHLGSVGNSNYIFGGLGALGNTLTALPNPEITWEESEQVDLGLNLAMFDRRLTLAFNVYQQITAGLLADIPLSWATGFGSVRGNQNSRIRNRGFELQLDLVPVRNRNLIWNTSFNVSQYKNLILEYFDSRGFFNGFAGNGTAIAVSAPGQPIGMYRGLKTLGLYTAAEINDPTVPKYAGAREGSQKYLDGNGDGKLGIEEDYVILGNPHPQLMFGWNNQVRWKGFNLRTIFAGQFGGLIYDLRREFMWNVDGNFNIDRQMLDRWRPGDDPATKTFPTTTSLTGSTTRYVRFPSDNKLYDGTYIALKNLTLGYNLAKLINGKRKLFEAAEFYGSVRNAFYIAAYKYGNPEIRRPSEGGAVRSVNYGSYPISRTITFGLNLTI